MKSDDILISVASVMKTFHNHGSKYIKKIDSSEKWMLPMKEPVETICHDYLVEYMKKEAENGNETFTKNIKEGHHDTYRADLEYFKMNFA